MKTTNQLQKNEASAVTPVSGIPNLNFYTRPFREAKYSGWVYDAKGNFVFEFEGDFDDKGNYVEGYKELCEKVIFSINAIERDPVEGLNLTLFSPIELLRNDKPFITIRGWGNLTGIGAHNFSGEKAEKIQDDFVQWLLYRLTPDCR